MFDIPQNQTRPQDIGKMSDIIFKLLMTGKNFSTFCSGNIVFDSSELYFWHHLSWHMTTFWVLNFKIICLYCVVSSGDPGITLSFQQAMFIKL